MICKHCHTAVNIQFYTNPIRVFWLEGGKLAHKSTPFYVEAFRCPECKNDNLLLLKKELEDTQDETGMEWVFDESVTRMVWPRTSNRPPTPIEVDDKEVASDYEEACLVLPYSPKASAALSRRCLQHLLINKADVPSNASLSDQIQFVLDQQSLRSELAESIDAIRNLGNFAAHPIKSKSTGEIVNVEVGEAEWNLDVLEMLFDFYYVQPARLNQRKETLNKKLKDAGKPEMK